ncbi:MAG: patatin-like phospholipase family protein [Muribaculaceae bacterium]|nr:patatin-like phospholipase family protein [Muribaculaceae bacterium]
MGDYLFMGMKARRVLASALVALASFMICVTASAATYSNVAVADSVTPAGIGTVDYPTSQSVGLVLSGGGAKGIAHIGVIQALEDNDIPIDYVAGTSMGAIVGGLYASGYTPQEMMDLILSKGFAMWSTGQIDPNLTYYFLDQPRTPAFAHLNINLNHKDSLANADLLPSSLISPLPMNFAFMDLFAAYTAQCGGDFDRLFVPFRCVTSDVVHKHKIVCRSGMLSDAIRASMSFPAVFQPIKMNGVDVYDGGIYDNFPVDVMREDFAPDIMIGVDVHSENAPQSNGIVAQLENMIIQNNDYDLPADEGIRVHIDVSQFSLLDFGKAREIYAIGYKRAMEMMDSIKGRVTSREPAPTRRLRRDVFKSTTPYVRFDSVSVSGGTPGQNTYLTHLFENTKSDTFGIEHARMAYYRALSPGKLRNLFPQAHYNDSTGLFSLDLEATPKNNFALGAGGYLTSSINSMIFVSASYASMSYGSWSTEIMGWVGQSYMAAQASGKVYLGKSLPSALEVTAVASRQRYYESDKLFYEDNSPAFISRREGFGRLSYSWAVGRRGKAMVGVGGGQFHNRFYANDAANFTETGKETTAMNLGQAMGRLEFNTLDNMNYPASGGLLKVTAIQTAGNYTHTFHDREHNRVETDREQHWFQAEVNAEKYYPFGNRFSLGTSVNLLVSNRKLLDTYYATVVNAPAFTPTAALEDVFNKAFHANSYVTAGITPIWRPFSRAQVRLSAHMFLPFRKFRMADNGIGVSQGDWFSDPEFVGELDVVYNLPFASVCGYVNYLSYPRNNWNAGLSFGLFFTAAKFLR